MALWLGKQGPNQLAQFEHIFARLDDPGDRHQPVTADLQRLYQTIGKVVPEGRFELPHPLRRRILNPLRLPFRHSGNLDAGFSRANRRRQRHL